MAVTVYKAGTQGMNNAPPPPSRFPTVGDVCVFCGRYLKIVRRDGVHYRRNDMHLGIGIIKVCFSLIFLYFQKKY